MGRRLSHSESCDVHARTNSKLGKEWLLRGADYISSGSDMAKTGYSGTLPPLVHGQILEGLLLDACCHPQRKCRSQHIYSCLSVQSSIESLEPEDARRPLQQHRGPFYIR